MKRNSGRESQNPIAEGSSFLKPCQWKYPRRPISTTPKPDGSSLLSNCPASPAGVVTVTLLSSCVTEIYACSKFSVVKC